MRGAMVGAVSHAGKSSLTTVASAPDVPSERSRQLFVRLVLVLFVLLITEGLLRKWAFPQFSQYLYFVRDPVVLVAYVVALRRRAFSPVHPLLAAGLVFSLVVLPMVAVQAGSGLGTRMLLFAAYGWRNYFLYLPLPFAIATQFRERDLRRLYVLTILALALNAPLAVAQYFAPPGAMINVGISDDRAFQFTNLGSANGHIRPPGTFTSVLGLDELASSTLAIVLACWILPREERPVSTRLTVVAVLAVAASVAVSGSRTMLIHIAIVVAGAVFAGPLMRRPALVARATTLPLAVTAAFIVLFPIVFPNGYSTLTTRWDQASVAEHGISHRMSGELTEFLSLVPQAPLAGYGLGLGGNAAAILKASNTDSVPYSETDWAHHIVDLGPILGPLFILYRVIFTVWLGWASLAATRRGANPLPALLFGYVGVVLIHNQITGNGVENGFCWLFVGVCMAACRVIGTTVVEAESPTLQRVALRRPPNLMT